MTDKNNDLHSKYRPRTLDEVIGHEAAVTRLRGQIKSGKLRSAYLFTGPSSVGKTTLARCLAAEINGKPIEQQTFVDRLLSEAVKRGFNAFSAMTAARQFNWRNDAATSED